MIISSFHEKFEKSNTKSNQSYNPIKNTTFDMECGEHELLETPEVRLGI